MANIHSLSSTKDESDDEKDESNNLYVGGVGNRGGGSGLAVEPNPNERGGSNRDAVFGLAQEAGNVGEGEQIRRTITMFRDGFTVDDGPYRRLDDPINADFLRSLAMGRTPRELAQEVEGGNIIVGLVDKRTEDYVETFRSFSGTGASLGASVNTSTDGLFDPSALVTPPVDSDGAVTSVAVRLPNGKRKVVKVALSATVTDLAAHLRDDAEGVPFRLSAGFPPQHLNDPLATIESAGLKGAQVSMQRV